MRRRNRYLLLVAMGAVIWFLAALCIRFAILAGWTGSGLGLALIFALSLVGASLGIELIHRIVRGDKGKMIRTAAVIALVGALLDGLAITWTPGLYAADRAEVSYGGAWLLWIVGTILAYALVRDRR